MVREPHGHTTGPLPQATETSPPCQAGATKGQIHLWRKWGSNQRSHQHPRSLQLWDATSKNTHTAKGGSIFITAVRASCAAAPLGKALSWHTKSRHFLKDLVLHSHWFQWGSQKKKSFSQTPISFLHRGTHKGGQNWGDCSQQGKKWQHIQQDTWPAGCVASLWRMEERKMGRVHR